MRLLGILSKPTGDFPIVVESNDLGTSVTMAQAKDESGKVSDDAAISRTRTYNYDGYVNVASAEAADAALAAIEAGNVATLGGKKYMIKTAKRSGKAGDYQRFSGTMERNDEADPVAYVAPVVTP